MAVQFILGRSGTGKTTYCINTIVEALQEPSSQSLILLVPEQATYQAERAVLSDERVRGYHRLHILSFARLQFLLLGKNAARPRISRLGRQMIVHKILRDVRDELQVFRASALLPGFAQEMAETITELHRYARTPEEMEGLPPQMDSGHAGRMAALKFADIALIFRRYTQTLQDRFIDPDAQVHDACRKVAQASFLKDARLWVDGFAGFTDGELALLVEMLKTVRQASMALCIDPGRISSGESLDGLFEPTLRTYHELCQLLDGVKIAMDTPVILKQPARFSTSPALAHLERYVFQLPARQSQARGSIRLVSASDLRAEVQFVAGQVRWLVQEHGYRYRDIAVVASDLGRYEHYVRAYFDDYAIPFFIDRRKRLNRHPVVELLGAALQAVTTGFTHADVFAYLKTDLAPVERSGADLLENYCLAFGVDGRDWANTEPWSFVGPDEEEFNERIVNRIRDQAMEPLRELREGLRLTAGDGKTLTAGDFTRAVFTFLERLHVHQKMEAWIRAVARQGDAEDDEHQQFFDRLVDIFDELNEVFGGESMAARDYAAILNLAFSQMTLGVIPPRLDQVLVGSIERSRHPDLKAVFLLGVTQKQFPIPLPTTGVLTDADRDAADTAGCRLAPASTQSLAERQYLAYIAFTRPSEFLCLSYPLVDEKGSPAVRSQFADDLQVLFTDLTEETVTETCTEIDWLYHEAQLAQLLCRRLGRDLYVPETEDSDLLVDLLAALRSDRDYAPVGAFVTAALSYDNQASLEDRIVGAFFGDELRSSATRLATFAACPFKYFARYSLGLRLRREFKLQPLDLGNFYHAVLDALHKRLVTEGVDFATVDDERLTARLHEQIATFASKDRFLSKFVSRSKHNAFVIHNAVEVLEDCVLDLARMARAGAFRPLLSEVPFGEVEQAETSLGTLRLTLPDGRLLTLGGKIDRLDVAEIEGRKVGLVFDYKTSVGGAKFAWPQFYHGLDIQLPMYLLAVLDAARPRVDAVAGAFCLPVQVPAESVTLGELAGGREAKPRRAYGLFDGTYAHDLDHEVSSRWSQFYNFGVTKDHGQYGYFAFSGALRPTDFGRVLEFARSKIVALATGVFSGAVQVHPYRLGTQVACSTCDYRSVCRFDWQINEYNFLGPQGKLEVVEELKGH